MRDIQQIMMETNNVPMRLLLHPYSQGDTVTNMHTHTHTTSTGILMPMPVPIYQYVVAL